MKTRLMAITLIYVAVLVIAWLATCCDTVVQTWAVVLTGLVIILYTHETYLLRVETQKQTELTQRPFVLAQVLNDGKVYVTNYGQGVALNVKIMPVTVNNDISIKFKDIIPILCSQETKHIDAESFKDSVSAEDFFITHLCPKYAEYQLILEVKYQNAELREYISCENISPNKIEILECKTRKT